MATIKFYIRKGKDKATIYTHLNTGKNEKFRTSTGLTIDPKQWNEKKGYPRNSVAVTRQLTNTLQKFEAFILEQYNHDQANGTEIKKDWLNTKTDTFFNRNQKRLYFSDFIEELIQEAQTRPNQKGGYGLSLNRIKNIRAFKKHLENYEAQELKKRLTLSDVKNETLTKFRDYLLSKGYSVNCTGSHLSTFKTICVFIQGKDLELSVKTEKISPLKEKKTEEDIIYLTTEELQKIEALTDLIPSLENTRKWLLLGCEIGQRGGDLLNLTEKNIIEIEGVKVVKLTQQKTGKQVFIPLTPTAQKIVQDFPKNIGQSAFNQFVKKLCRLAGITQKVKGRQTRTETTATQIVEKEKWEFISSHTCRRSFASNYYGKIPTATLKMITGHSTEEMFLRYIGKTAFDHAKEMITAFKMLKM